MVLPKALAMIVTVQILPGTGVKIGELPPYTRSAVIEEFMSKYQLSKQKTSNSNLVFSEVIVAKEGNKCSKTFKRPENKEEQVITGREEVELKPVAMKEYEGFAERHNSELLNAKHEIKDEDYKTIDIEFTCADETALRGMYPEENNHARIKKVAAIVLAMIGAAGLIRIKRKYL
jgi:hypothetical protein